ncbi:hypothetical protein [Haloechinothrix sp. LS1_15]|uniref:hypothetical protein n=1 Tax=Haloechinothrix sp. LS1_15 TaxID=2652248 RepID=UPI002945D986|nr:hypothetical protein [Haloechinothrix sp. LS1_15]MDV6013222.1 hypothetical protein [Haloechinothrix sp. LS1_15]
MADTVAEQNTGTDDAPKQRDVAVARRFVAEHGSPARGVVQGIGRSGVRVVLVGADGAMGDVLVPSVRAGEALIDRVDGLERANWDAETVNATDIGPERRRRMGRSLTRA